MIQTEGVNFGDTQAFNLFLFLGLGFALFNEYIVKNFIKLMDDGSHKIYRFNLINKTGVLSFILNLVYGFAIMFPMISILVFLAKHNLTLDLLNPVGQKAAIEPFTGGFVYLILDCIVVSVKNLIDILIRNRKYKVQEAKDLDLEKELMSLTDEQYLEKCKENI